MTTAMHTVAAPAPSRAIGAVPAPPRRRPGRPEKPVARGDLIRVARELFAARGFAAVSMADIAHSAGLQKSSLFHHFATKDGLYQEVVTQVVEEASRLVLSEIGSKTGWAERADALSGALATFFGEDNTRAQILCREFVGEAVPKPLADNMHALLQAAVRFLEEGMAAGAFVVQDPRQLVMSIAGLHLVHFAMPAIGARLLSRQGDARAQVEARAAAVRVQTRLLLGIKSPA
jgi:AcrR family transcriptional regulator